MKIDASLRTHIESAFAALNHEAAVNAFPPTGALSEKLFKIHVGRLNGAGHGEDLPTVAKMFTTAAVNMWMRAVHAFLVSSSLTDVSPVWASVAGYYSSHYA